MVKFNALAFLKLVRWPNLLIIAVTQLLMRYAILDPLLQYFGMSLQLPAGFFFLLVLSTVCLAAAGYVINDYFDTRTDLINRPKDVIIGRSISRRMAMSFHIVLNIIGVFCGALVALKIGMTSLILIFVLITGLLWFYSTSYKRQLLLGNLMVAVLTGLVPLMVLLFEIPLLKRSYYDILVQMGGFRLFWAWIGAFAIFAFLLTLIREIIKDVEDMEGDIKLNRNTLPIKWGVKNARNIIVALSFISITLLLTITFLKILDLLTIIYVLLLIVLPWLVCLRFVLLSYSPQNYHKASFWCKITMLGGILYAILARYLILAQFA
jgi:4-hydroxybenzoate polyprenyltransferase